MNEALKTFKLKNQIKITDIELLVFIFKVNKSKQTILFLNGSAVKNLPAMQELQETQVQYLGWEYHWKKKWQPTSGFLPEKPHGQRSLVGYNLCCCKELDTTEWISTHTRKQTIRQSQSLIYEFLIRSFFSWYQTWKWKKKNPLCPLDLQMQDWSLLHPPRLDSSLMLLVLTNDTIHILLC